METKTLKNILVVLIVLVSGLVGYAIGMGKPYMPMHTMMDGTKMQNSATSMEHEMSGMMMDLSGKKGDELDKAFLSGMIVHHEGAVDMAKAVLADGKHPELRVMAQAIIAAQTTEIAQMKMWQKSWYGI